MIIVGALLAVLQCLSWFGVMMLLGLALAVVVPHLLPGYSEVSAVYDAQGILLVLLLWDRFNGPYSKLLRGVAAKLKQARKSA
jgi:hypothetical protein